MKPIRVPPGFSPLAAPITAAATLFVVVESGILRGMLSGKLYVDGSASLGVTGAAAATNGVSFYLCNGYQ